MATNSTMITKSIPLNWLASAVPFSCLFVFFVAGLLLFDSASAAEPLSKRFAAADADGDKRISLDELLKLSGEKDVLKRDFQLFDQDANKFLSATEFDAVPLGRPAAERGALPDPFAEIVDRAMEQLDETYNNWDQNPRRQINVQDFIQSFLLSFPNPDRLVSFPEELRKDADADQNQRVTRDEARRFLEIQLGIRRSDGHLLRLPTGQVVANTIFIAIDANRDQSIDRAEFLAKWPRQEGKEEVWTLIDKDKDGQISFVEFSASPLVAVFDAVEQFRKLDANLDSFVDAQELLAGSDAADKPLAERAFPGFDLNGDKKLSLWEYRQLPQANPVMPWNAELSDLDRNGVLDFLEFSTYGGRFPLLRLIYFYRFDLNGNGSLDTKEFAYKTFPTEALFRLNADGTGWKKIFSSEKYVSVGSPKISRDGKWIACDAVLQGQSDRGRVMLVMTIDGENVRELGVGMMPTWSADGKKIAYSSGGVQIMDVESRETRQLVPGWSAQWSPDGKRVAFTQGPALKTIDVNTEEVQELLTQQDSPYRQIYWNLGWAPDGERIVFKGINRNGQSEVASVSTSNPPDLKIHYDGKQTFSNNFAWSPDGARVVFGMQSADNGRMQLHEFNPNAKDEPKRLAGADLELLSDDSCWSPDGKFLIMNGRPQ